MTTTRPRGLIYFLASLVLILASLVAIPAHAVPATDEEGLRELIAQAGASPAEIEVDGSIALTETLVIPAGANLTLRPATEEGASLLGQSVSGSVVVRVDEGASLTLDPTGAGILTVSAGGAKLRVLDIMGTAVINDGLITGMSGYPGRTGLPSDARPGAVTVTGAGNLTMNGGAIADNDMGTSTSDVQETGANISVSAGGTFTLNGGEIRDGRSAPRNYAFYATGGLGLFGSATFTMKGGRITGNEGGTSGGISINAGSLYWDGDKASRIPEHKASWEDPNLGITVDIAGGEISNNRGYFYGGGIGGFGKFDITMTGGTITNNWAQFHGGGVHVQDYYVTGDYGVGAGGWRPGAGQKLGYSLDEWKAIVPASFTMTGGTISNNFAGSSGGGVNVVSDSVYLTGGNITGNRVPGGQAMGGGIYVGSQPYTLHLENAHFHENMAWQGGAIWNCPTGHTVLHVEDGAAFTDNTASRFGNDLQVYPIGQGAGQDIPEMDMRLATRMLGGERLDWYVDGYRNRKFAPSVDRYVPKSRKGILVDPAELKANPSFIGLAAEPDNRGKSIPTCNTLVIANNRGGMGGGLGTNGNVIIGTEAEPVSLKVLKKWATGATPPEELKVHLYAGENKIDTAILTEESEWTAVFEDLPRKICGKKVSYSIREVATEGWTTVISDPVSSTELTAEAGEDPDITITNSPLVSLKVLKEWDGDHPPASLDVTLLADGEPVDNATLSAENNWQHIFTGLPAAKNGEAISYTIAEAEIPGWTSTVSEPVPGTDLPASMSPEDPATITLTNSQLTELKVEKVWQAGGHELPASVDVTLLANGEEVATATLSAENNWQHVFTGLPVAKDGTVITYSIAEAELEGWAGVVTGAVSADELRDSVAPEDPADITLTNTKLTELKVEKIWHAGGSELPESLGVTLLADGEEVATATLNAENNWQHVFTGLPVAKDGKVITYSIAEADLEGWAGVVTGAVSADELRDSVAPEDPADITLTNTKLTELKVEKVWHAGGSELPESLGVTLLADGEEVATATLNAENNWQHVFTGLPVAKDGTVITYSIAEADLPGWAGVVSDPVSGSDLRPEVGPEDSADITLTNTKLTELKVEKIWHAGGAELPELLDVTLLADGEEVATATLNADNNWQHVFTGLPVAKDGKVITYSIVEAELEGWSGVVTGAVSGNDLRETVGADDPADITLTNTKLTELKVEKIWQAGGHELPASVDVTLLADGEEVAAATLSAENDWQHVFTGLPVAKDGKVITYSIAEAELEGWAGVVTGAVSGNDLRETVGADDPADITLTNTKLTELKVEKVWQAGGHELPASVDVTLLADGEEVAAATLSAENNWQHVFTGLPVAKDGKVITYSIAEAELEGWAGVVTGAVSGNDLRETVGVDDPADITLTNTKLTELKVEKVWHAGGAELPESLDVTLLADGEEVATATLTAENDWQHIFTGLPVAKDGKVITYSIAEVDLEGWSGVVTGAVSADELRDSVAAEDPADITLTNTKLVSVTGTKVWVGGEGPRPEIELQLMRAVEGEEPEAVGEPQVLADGVTEVTWEGLPATDAEGRTYTYSVDEVNVPEGYEMVRVDNVTVENHLLPPPTDPPSDPPTTIPPSDPPSTVPPTEPPAEPPLVHTGASVAHLAILGAMLIAAGTVAVVRRRRAE